ncbi:hypothetical protein Tco_1434318, partial [Tanacetum coccineum]
IMIESLGNKSLRLNDQRIVGDVWIDFRQKRISAKGEVFSETFLAVLRFMDDGGNPLVPAGIMDSDSKVEVVFNETTNSRLSTSGKDGSDKGYGTNSLLEQWRDSLSG